MKCRFVLLLVWVAIASLAFAQSSHDPKSQRRSWSKGKSATAQKVGGIRHKHADLGGEKVVSTAKPGSTAAQLKELERQTSQTGTGKTAGKAAGPPATKGAKTAGGNKPIVFQYHRPKGGTNTAQPARSGGGRRSGIRTRVSGH